MHKVKQESGDTPEQDTGNLKLRIPKTGAYVDKDKKDISVYDFTDELEDQKPLKLEHKSGTTPPAKLALNLLPHDHKDLKVDPDKAAQSSQGLKLKVSGGKIVR